MFSTPMRAVAVFHHDKKVQGTVYFTEEPAHRRVRIDIDLVGTALKPNTLHGFHVHECGDLTDQCESMCAHFNPYGKKHGCPGKKERHVGDLGNLVVDSHGQARYTTYDDVIQLRGSKCNILGRGLIVHADPDDCGEGVFSDSLVTGHAGKRVACAVIGYASTQKGK